MIVKIKTKVVFVAIIDISNSLNLSKVLTSIKKKISVIYENDFKIVYRFVYKIPYSHCCLAP